MTNRFVITLRGAVLHGAIGERARAVAEEYFKDAGVLPLDAATQAFLQEGPIDYGQTKRDTDAAEVWRCAPVAVARVLGVGESEIAVNLDRGQ